jgi:hypothetical protein
MLRDAEPEAREAASPEDVWRKESSMAMNERSDERHDFDPLSKVPRVTLAFWVIKIFATTLGDTLTKPHEQGGL